MTRDKSAVAIPWRTLARRFDDGFWQACVATALPDRMSDIDEVNWQKVESCYCAPLIPLMLRGLCAEDTLVGDKALACLNDEIHHQGSTFESSKLVVKFLVKLLELNAPVDRLWVIDLIKLPGLWELAPAKWRNSAEVLNGLQLGREWHKKLGVKKCEWGVPTSTYSASDKPRLRFLSWHENGAFRLDGTYFVGNKNWIEDSHARGLKDGTWRQSSSAGKLLGEYVITEGSGTELSWHDNGELRSHREVVSGIHHGRTASWHDNGQREEESNWGEGKRRGVWKKWCRDGKLEREGEYKNNVEHGRFVTYDKHGYMEEERGFQRGKRHGIANSYTAGVKIVAGQFKQGKRDGAWEHWDKDGRHLKTVIWQKNKMLRVERGT